MITRPSIRMFAQAAATSFKKPHLVLFVDVNGTIIAGDTERGKDRDTSIKHMLAEWKGVWDTSITTEEKSYYDFLDDDVLHELSPAEQQRLRDDYFANFLTFLKETNNPLYDEAQATFEKARAILSEDDGEVFPSFINMIHELERRKENYTIIFRSFGTDTDFVLDEIEKKTGVNFSQHLHFEQGVLISGGEQAASPEEMLAHVKPGVHGKWADDFQHWDSNDRKYHAAKTYPLDSEKLNDTLTIFFDDNTLDKEIIHVCDKQGDGGKSQDEIREEMIKQGRLVHLETLDAILDPNHFIDYVDAAYKFREKKLAECDAQHNAITRLT